MQYDKVIAILQTDKPGDGCRTDVRLVSWNNDRPVFEQRQFTFDKTKSEFKTGRARGFTLEEFIKLINNKDEIIRLWKEYS